MKERERGADRERGTHREREGDIQREGTDREKGQTERRDRQREGTNRGCESRSESQRKTECKIIRTSFSISFTPFSFAFVLSLSTLFNTTTSRSERSSPITRHSAV